MAMSRRRETKRSAGSSSSGASRSGTGTIERHGAAAGTAVRTAPRAKPIGRKAPAAAARAKNPAPPSSLTLRSAPGPAGASGKDMTLAAELPAALAAAAEPVRIPRPNNTRYPISHQAFLALKESSRASKPLALRSAFVARDARRRPKEGPVIMAMAAADASAPPTGTSTPVSNYPGLSQNGFIPWDCTLAVGPNHVVASLNSTIGVFDKNSGASVTQRTLSAWFANVITNAKIFDPKVLYDQHAGRWILLAVSLQQNPDRSRFLISISKTSDPSAGWKNYSLDAALDGTKATKNWADYPCLGVDSQAIYVTANMFPFDPNGVFQYAKVRVIPKAGPYAGGTMKYSDIVKLKNEDGSLAFTVQPCHTFGAPEAQYLVNSFYPTESSPTQNRLSLWELRMPLQKPAITRKTVVTDPYGLPPDADQKGGGMGLDSGDVRVLNAVFNAGSVWCAFTTRHVWNPPQKNTAAVHWFQINAPAATLAQQGIFGAAGSHSFFPAVMPDVHGNVLLVFCRSSSTEFASIHYSGRAAADPPGSLQNSTLLKAGLAHYEAVDNNGINRWGDYCGIGLDPADSRTVRFAAGYAIPDDKWATWIGGARF